MGMTEYEDEPVEGLPEHLPEGETMVWQGSAHGRAMGKRGVLHPTPHAVFWTAMRGIPSIA
ncbi:MAG: hypothetical protein CM15mP103_03270 [Gammaproteobacteria bacterium]|nr:MAG: hypothetical protein CM15mP103_03270 [Gammaproteobacteria bacterium]